MKLSDDILQLRGNLSVSIENILSILELNENVLRVANSKLEQIQKSLLKIKIGGGVAREIENASALLTNLSDNPQIMEQKKVIKEQVIVLLVGTLESYLGDFIREVGNKKPELFDLKNKDEKISFTQEMLSSGFNLGDAILEHVKEKGYTLQDLKSSIDVFSNYLSINISLEDSVRDKLILCAASRNCIVHNSSKVDRKFLKQVRNTRYKSKYKLDEFIDIDDDLINSSKLAILDYADQLTAAIIDKEGNE